MVKGSLKERLKNDALKAMIFVTLGGSLSANASTMSAPVQNTTTMAAAQGVQQDDDTFDIVYNLEKKAAEALANGGDAWLDINREILDIQEYWTPEQIRAYHDYKEERQKEERVHGYWKAIKKATNEGRKEHKRIIRAVQIR